jgi:uncharacterized protein (DUF433 family)
MSRITVSPDIHFGKPCIAGTRITVQNVLELITEGIRPQEIIRDYYPELTAEDIQACLMHQCRTVSQDNETTWLQGE